MCVKERDAVLEAIKKCYYYKMNKNLPVYGVPKCIKKYEQSKSDSKKGKEKNFPKVEYLLTSEDIEKSGAILHALKYGEKTDVYQEVPHDLEELKDEYVEYQNVNYQQHPQQSQYQYRQGYGNQQNYAY